MDERGNRTFGAADGELDGATARRLIADGLNGHKPKPVVGPLDAVVIVAFVAVAALLVWWATC